jgi:hypothetical protein
MIVRNGYRHFILLLMAVGTTHALAQTLTDYVKARKSFGITQSTTSLALSTLIGEATMEIRATVKGVFSAENHASILVEVPGASPIMIRGGNIPHWLRNPNIEARMLIRARRTSEFSPLDAQLLHVIDEKTISDWESKQKPSTPPNRQPTSPSKTNKREWIDYKATSRSTTSTREPREWNVTVQEAVPVYADFIRSYNKKLTPQKATEIAKGIIGFSVEFGVDARLITAMVLCESGFNPNTTSHKGAMGLGQLMPGTARGLGVRNAYDTYDNLWGTVKLVRGHLEKYQTTGPNGERYPDLVLALAAYNAGSGAVRRHGGVPPYRETQNYIQKVIRWYKQLAGIQ